MIISLLSQDSGGSHESTKIKVPPYPGAGQESSSLLLKWTMNAQETLRLPVGGFHLKDFS